MYFEQKTSLKHETTSHIDKSNQKLRWKKQKANGTPIFISKTFQILENNSYKEVISWNEQGTNFIISDVQRFQQQVLPVHFRHRNFSSFVRQLNMYDFHKIRNDNNKNIFQHKQFKKNHRESIKNIKRKACNPKKYQQNESNLSRSDYDDLAFDMQETPRKQQKCHQTVETYDKDNQFSPMLSIRFIQSPLTQYPDKKQKMQEFMKSLPDIIRTEDEVHQKINELIHDPNYECINSKNDIKKLISKIRRKIPKPEKDEDLQELSIEQEIIAENIIQNQILVEEEIVNPSLAVLSTEKFLPKSINLIGSMNFCQDTEHLFYQKNY